MTWAHEALLTPDVVRAWIRVFRDLAIVLAGLYIVLHELHKDGEPRWEWIAAALICWGLAPVLRADEWLRERTNGGDGNGRR